MNIILFAITMLIQAPITGADSSPTVKNVRAYIQKQDIKHPDIVLAQAIVETGWFECVDCSLDSNNLFGWSHDGETYIHFEKWQDSIDQYKLWQLRNYSGGDYYEFLRQSKWKGSASMDGYINLLSDIAKSLNKK